jgi:hypothetical protein
VGTISLSIPQAGQPDSIEEPKIANDLTIIQNWANGGIDTNNLHPTRAGITAAQLASAIADASGINDGTTVRRGKSIIATEETRTNTAYGTLPTPDRVQSVVLPTDGLLRISYQALWRNSVASTGLAAVFVGATQPSVATGVGAPVVQAAFGASTAFWATLASTPGGLSGVDAKVADESQVGTQIVGTSIAAGGWFEIFAPAGTYNVTVQFKSSSGTVSVKQRKLWVEAVAYV